jgi:hypothetical protein
MRRWQVTAVLVVLAGAGVTLAAGMPAGAVVIGHGQTLLQTLWEAVDPTWRDEMAVHPLPVEHTIPEVHAFSDRSAPVPTTIPELSEPIRPTPPILTVLPPDPVPVRYGCGGRAVRSDEPMPACGMG